MYAPYAMGDSTHSITNKNQAAATAAASAVKDAHRQHYIHKKLGGRSIYMLRDELWGLGYRLYSIGLLKLTLAVGL